MMLGCDLVIAAAEASFGLPEPRVGLLPPICIMLLTPSGRFSRAETSFSAAVREDATG